MDRLQVRIKNTKENRDRLVGRKWFLLIYGMHAKDRRRAKKLRTNCRGRGRDRHQDVRFLKFGTNEVGPQLS